MHNKYPLKPIRSTFPNQVVQFDHLTLKTTVEGHKGVLVIIDHFSKYAAIVPVKLMDAKETAKILFEEWILKYSVPTGWFQSDRGAQFTAEVTTSLMQLLIVEHRYSTPNKPQNNGAVERSNHNSPSTTSLWRKPSTLAQICEKPPICIQYYRTYNNWI